MKNPLSLPLSSPPKSYIIQIDEAQRLALLALINEARAAVNPSGSIEEEPPLAYWDVMLSELPAMEAENPRAVHGFCL
jgi:hypothetical protein